MSNNVEALVLSVNTATKIARCYSEQLECEIQVQLPDHIRANRGHMLEMSDFTCENDIWIPIAESFRTRTAPNIRYHCGEMLIETFAACSDKEVHKTYEMKEAFTERYGLVAVSEYPPKRGVAYEVDLAINKIGGPGSPLFRIVRVKKPVVGNMNKKFVEKMMTYENEKLPQWEVWPENPDDQLSVANTSQTSEETPAATEHRAASTVPPTDILASDERIESMRGENSSAESIERNFYTHSVSSQRCSPVMQALLKPESEITCLVLEVGVLITAWETTKMRLLRIRANPVPIGIEEYRMFKCIVGDYTDGVLVAKEGTATLIESEKRHKAFVPARIGFSGNCNYTSFNFSVGVSDEYGHIEMPHNVASYDRSLIYGTEVEIHQFSDPWKPIFRVMENAPIMPLASTDSNDNFFSTIKKYEEDFFNEYQRNGLGSTLQSPRRPSPPVQVERIPGDGMFKKTNTETITTALVISLQYQKEKKIHGYVWTPFGSLSMRNEARAQDGTPAQLGNWVSIRLEKRKIRNGKEKTYHVDKILTVYNNDEDHPKILFENGLATCVCNIHFRILKGTAMSDAAKFYATSFLGVVEVPDAILRNIDLTDTAFLKFKMIPRPFLIGKDMVSWIAQERVNELGGPSPPNYNEANCSSSEKGYMGFGNDFGRESNGPSTSSNGYNGPPMPRYESGPSTRVQSRQFSEFSDYGNPQVQQVPRPMSVTGSVNDHEIRFESLAFPAIELPDGRWIVHLHDANQPAFMNWRETSGVTVLFGANFSCRYKRTQNPNDDIFWEIITIEKIINEGTNIKIDEKICALKCSVNLCEFTSQFNKLSEFGVLPVVAADFGLIMLGRKVKTPNGKVVDGYKIRELYEGNRDAMNMVGFCRYAKHQYPRIMMDRQARDNETSCGYVYELYEIVGTDLSDQLREQELERQNLPQDCHDLLHDDDVARQKKLNKLEEARANCANERQSSYAPSNQGRLSSAQSYHTVPDFSRPPSSYNGSVHGNNGGRTPIVFHDAPQNLGNQQPQSSSAFGYSSAGPSRNMTPHPDLLDQIIQGHRNMSTAIDLLARQLNGCHPDVHDKLMKVLNLKDQNDEMVRDYDFSQHQARSSHSRR